MASITTHILANPTGQALTLLGVENGNEPMMVVTPYKHFAGWFKTYMTGLGERGAIAKMKKLGTKPPISLKEVKARHPDVVQCMEQAGAHACCGDKRKVCMNILI